MPKIYDITRTVAPELHVWPGDTPYSLEWVMTKAKGSNVNLSTLTLSAHTGTHADAPYHYANDGLHPAESPLEPYIGKAHVVTIDRQHGGMVPADFARHNLTGVERLLIHTWVSDLPDTEWPQNFPYPTVELIDWLAAQGGVLLGLDVPSTDDFHGEGLPGHHRLKHHGMFNLETLLLKDVPDGVYELVALPLKLVGACGSPVRAILREI